MKNNITRFSTEHKYLIAELLSDIGYDGHTIWKASILENFPQEIISRFVRVHKSNKKDYKSSIFDGNGKLIESLEGIYGLSLLTAIAQDLGLEYEGKIGRGFQAQEITKAIKAWLEQNGVELSMKEE